MRLLLWVVVMGACACSSKPPEEEFGVFTVVVAGDLVLVGQSFGVGKRGAFAFKTVSAVPAIKCEGEARYSRSGVARTKFACSDGGTGSIRFCAYSPFRGGATGTSSFGPVQALLGHSVLEVNQSLMPPGRALALAADGVTVMEVTTDPWASRRRSRVQEYCNPKISDEFQGRQP